MPSLCILEMVFPWSGTIAYTEFLAAIMDHHIEERKDLALAAFRGFDVDGSGTISSKEMERVTWVGEKRQNFHKFVLAWWMRGLWPFRKKTEHGSFFDHSCEE